jgi:hypothetical protein
MSVEDAWVDEQEMKKTERERESCAQAAAEHSGENS